LKPVPEGKKELFVVVAPIEFGAETGAERFPPAYVYPTESDDKKL